jgi:hypothetical protein
MAQARSHLGRKCRAPIRERNIEPAFTAFKKQIEKIATNRRGPRAVVLQIPQR